MTTAKALLAELAQEAETTRRVLERVPEDKLGWRPHEKSITLGQLALHAASLPEAACHEAVLSVLERSLGSAKTLLEWMNDADLALLAEPSIHPTTYVKGHP